MSERTLTFELHPDEELAIHGSAEGLEALANTLLRLVQRTKDGHFDHDHLMTKEWGGSELSSVPQSEDPELLNHVKIYCWKGNKFQE